MTEDEYQRHGGYGRSLTQVDMHASLRAAFHSNMPPYIRTGYMHAGEISVILSLLCTHLRAAFHSSKLPYIQTGHMRTVIFAFYNDM